MPKLSEEEKARRLAIVRRLYPTTPGTQIDREQGWARCTSQKIAVKAGITHTAACLALINRIKSSNINKAQTGECYRRALAKRERRRKMDGLRILQGEAPRYNFRWPSMPRKTYKARFYLMKRYGFTLDEDSPFTLYYDEALRRRIDGLRGRSLLERYAEKYHLRFLPL